MLLHASSDVLPMRMLAEPRIDALFAAMADATQDAVLDALMTAETTIGCTGTVRPGLRSVLKGL
jgi:D-aminopeptidase